MKIFALSALIPIESWTPGTSQEEFFQQQDRLASQRSYEILKAAKKTWLIREGAILNTLVVDHIIPPHQVKQNRNESDDEFECEFEFKEEAITSSRFGLKSRSYSWINLQHITRAILLEKSLVTLNISKIEEIKQTLPLKVKELQRLIIEIESKLPFEQEQDPERTTLLQLMSEIEKLEHPILEEKEKQEKLQKFYQHIIATLGKKGELLPTQEEIYQVTAAQEQTGFLESLMDFAQSFIIGIRGFFKSSGQNETPKLATLEEESSEFKGFFRMNQSSKIKTIKDRTEEVEEQGIDKKEKAMIDKAETTVAAAHQNRPSPRRRLFN